MGLFSLETLIFALFFFIPGFLANSSAAGSSKIKPFSNWNKPLDFGKTFGGKRILGDHKTIRGLIVGTTVAIFGGYLQFLLIKFGHLEIKFDIYSSLKSTLILSFLLGFGALAGDCSKSFFKRRRDIKPGKPWIPFDWVDYPFGALICSVWYFNPGAWVYLVLFPICLLGSSLTNTKDFYSEARLQKIVRRVQKFYGTSRKSKDKHLTAIVRPLHRLGVHPNQVTAFGFLCALFATYLLFNSHSLFVLFSLLYFLSDTLDGTLARTGKINNRFGEQLDAISDTLFGVLLLSKSYLHYKNPLILVPLFLYLWEAMKWENWVPGFHPNSAFTKIFFLFRLYTVGIIAQLMVSLFNISVRKTYDLKYDSKS